MNAPLRTALLIALATAGLGACSKTDSTAHDVAAAGSETTGMATAQPNPDDPCSLLTDGEVRAVFPGAQSGKRDHRQDEYGMATCIWELRTNQFGVQIFDSTTSADGEARGRMLGFLDPLKPALREQLAYDTVAGLGDEATAVAVKGDEQRGIFNDANLLVVRRGKKMLVLSTLRLVDDSTDASKRALQALAKASVARL
ncbi:MAG TPA: hypothetical protein VM146_16905 [Steroidobacteraceae bacterium]|nr:hypothetical protein [Steroidobacteraceae bacterium]